MQVGVGQSGVSVVIVVDAVTSVEIVVVTVARQLVETCCRAVQLRRRDSDLGREVIPAIRRLDHTGLQPGFRDLASGGHRGEGDLRYRQMTRDYVVQKRSMVGDEPPGEVSDARFLALDHRVAE